MTAIYSIGDSHAYTVIREYGQESLEQLEILINYMTKNNIPLPNIKNFEKYSIEENRGWGNKFDGRSQSTFLHQAKCG